MNSTRNAQHGTRNNMAISTRTFKLLALMGYPLGHSLSPPMHMAALRHLKIRGLYLPFEIDPKKFKTIMRGIHLLPLSGFNVTVPFKEKVVPFLDTLAPEAKIIGAVNTVKRGRKLVGYNTDAYGFARSLKEDLKFSPRGKRVLVIGAGGAARACVYALVQGGAKTIVIADVVASKARRLKARFSRRWRGVRILAIKADRAQYKILLPEVDLVVNATPIGLKKTDPSVLPSQIFPRKKMYVYDLVYNPKNTRLMRIARSKGCRTANGLGMLLYQGVRAFEIWTGRRAPVAVMKSALRRALR